MDLQRTGAGGNQYEVVKEWIWEMQGEHRFVI